jgi:hypothetical protein
LSDPEVLVGLIKVINPAYKNPGKEKLKALANSYKRCVISSSLHFPFDDEQTVNSFDKIVRNEYPTALKRMIGFVNDFIDLNAPVHKDVNLARALIDLIQQDESISNDDKFYIDKNGEQIKKAALGDLRSVCLPAFMLGVWHYVVVNRKDNTVGKETYDAWCPTAGGGQRKYTAQMGKGILEGLTVYMDYGQEAKTTETADKPTGDTSAVSTSECTSPVTQQMYNNNPTFFTFNITGGNNNFYQHVDKVTNNYGGK